MAQIENGANVLAVDSLGNASAILKDAAGNAAVLAEGAQPSSQSGVVAMGFSDRMAIAMRVDRSGGQASALHNALFNDSFEGTAPHTLRWLITATTMAATQATVGGVVMNSGAITTINTGYLMSSVKRFLASQRSPMYAKFRVRANHFNNSVFEFGYGDASVFNGAHTAGAYWQMTASGVMQPVVTFNGVDQTGVDVRSLMNNANHYTFDVYRDDDSAMFVMQDTSTGLILSKQSINLPLTGARLWSATALPIFARQYNTGTAPATAPQMILTDAYVLGLDQNQQRPWPDACAGLNRSAMENPFTGAQLAAWANSAEPASAVLSNTAAGYTTLGGKFQFAAVAGAVTDFALFGFQVPVPANLTITGVDIETWNTGAAVATTPTLLTWALAVGSTAVSLATATATRVGLGAQSLAIGTAIGGMAPRLSKQFRTPLFCGPARFVHVILRMPVGTATAAQVIAGMVNIEGYTD